METQFDIIIVGGGAAGFFTAINCVEKNPTLKVAILERGKEVLTKVRVSGGGRCNVTHACFEPQELVKFYPRGEKELRGPFHQFCSGDTIEWFESKGIKIKTEADGRMFPESNSSQTIIDCFLKATQKLGIAVIKEQSVQLVVNHKDTANFCWEITTQKTIFFTNKIVFTSGSNPKIWELLRTMGHSIIEPVPSLFTFNIKDSRIENLAGIAAQVEAQVADTKLKTTGALLITHWGMSGPAILKLSAWGARIFAEKNYQFTLKVNWLKDLTKEDAEKILLLEKQQNATKTIVKNALFNLSNRLWERLVVSSEINDSLKWADVSKNQLQNLSNQLTHCTFKVEGKSTFKEEFVTAGGIDLKEINFKTMESKILKNVYFAGEILNIDAVTGGFNFQNAWTSGFIVAQNIGNTHNL
jgi:predicted Rossmann fold flavoprotein